MLDITTLLLANCADTPAPSPGFLESQLAGIIVGGLIAAVTSIISILMTSRKFQTERWWEKKAEAYLGISEALCMISDHAEAYLLMLCEPSPHGGIRVERLSYNSTEACQQRKNLKTSVDNLRSCLARYKIILEPNAILILEKAIAEHLQQTTQYKWAFTDESIASIAPEQASQRIHEQAAFYAEIYNRSYYKIQVIAEEALCVRPTLRNRLRRRINSFFW